MQREKRVPLCRLKSIDVTMITRETLDITNDHLTLSSQSAKRAYGRINHIFCVIISYLYGSLDSIMFIASQFA